MDKIKNTFEGIARVYRKEEPAIKYLIGKAAALNLELIGFYQILSNDPQPLGKWFSLDYGGIGMYGWLDLAMGITAIVGGRSISQFIDKEGVYKKSKNLEDNVKTPP